MIKYMGYEEQFNDQVYNLFLEVIKVDGLYKPLNRQEFDGRLLKNNAFKAEGTFLAFDGDELIGFISSNVKENDLGNDKASGYINTVLVKNKYQRNGIGNHLLKMAENYIKDCGMKSARYVFLSGINWPWYIPHTDHHEHPGAPGVSINSELYFFLLHNDYYINSIHEGFHLPLSEYELPQKVVDTMAKNNENGLSVELYDPAYHYGLDEFYQNINNPGFVNSIKSNLAKEKPYPFFVASNKGKVVGWTGAMYNEPTGRGHLDGIVVDPSTRGTGLGKALFCYLCEYSKQNGSSYMTFFTGLDNPARKIYLYAGFKIAQSFADMKKNL